MKQVKVPFLAHTRVFSRYKFYLCWKFDSINPITTPDFANDLNVDSPDESCCYDSSGAALVVTTSATLAGIGATCAVVMMALASARVPADNKVETAAARDRDRVPTDEELEAAEKERGISRNDN